MRGADDTAEEVRRLMSQRADAMAVLVDGACRKDELTDALDVSRSTVDRTVRQLEAAGLVRRDGGTVSATAGGWLAYDSYCRYREETERIAEFGDLLAALPPSADLGHEMLDGATAYRSEPPTTGQPANEITDLIRRGTGMDACASAINDSAAAEQFYRMITERGGRGSVVYTSSLADHLREEYFESHHEMAATGRFRAFETDSLPHELFVVDADGGTTAAVLVYDDAGTVRGTIINGTDAAVEWAAATLERYREAATEFTDDFRVGTTAGDTADEEEDGTGAD